MHISNELFQLHLRVIFVRIIGNAFGFHIRSRDLELKTRFQSNVAFRITLL